MKKVFNPFTGTFDFVGTGGTSGGITIEQAVKSILVESNQTIDFPIAAILFDEDSILFNDDGATL